MPDLARTGMLALALTVGMASAQPAADPESTMKSAGASASKPLLTYAYGADPQQMADLRVPSGRGPFPVAIIIHGGCWRAAVADRASIASLADALGRRGFATWNIEYRRVGNPGGGWPGTFEDVAHGVDALAKVAPGRRLDLNRVTLVGHSAGAHLALWAASRPKLSAPWSDARIRPVSVVAIDGPAALAPFIGIDAMACPGGPVIVPFMGGTPAERPQEYKIASPADHLPLGVHQLLVGGELGPLMRPYMAAARLSGDAVDVLEPAGANHFDIVTPGTVNGEAVVDFIASKALPPRRSGR